MANFVMTPKALPAITSTSFNDATDIWEVNTNLPDNGNWHWARATNNATDWGPDGLGGWTGGTGSIELSNTISVGLSPADLDIPEGGITGTQYELFMYQRTSGGADSNTITTSYTADNTAPTLSNIAVTAGDTVADIDWDTNEANGQAFWVLTTSANTPSQAQIEEGNDHTGGAAFASGAPSVTTTSAQNTINVTGLTNGTTYYFYIFHKDSHRNSSSTGSANGTPTVPGLTLAYLTQDLTIAAGTTYDFTPTLSSAANKRVYAHVGINHGDSATSVTIGGVSATLVTGTSDTVTATRSEIWYADLGASPTNTLQVVANISASACGFSAWSVDGTITSHTGNSDSSIGTAAPWTDDLSLTTVAGSIVMAGGFSSNTTLNLETQVGVTQNAISTDTNRTEWGAMNTSPGAGSPHTITVGDTDTDLGRWTCSSVEVR